MELIKNLFKSRFIRYCFGGGISAIADLVIFFLLNEILSLHYIYALIIAFTIASVINYSLQRKITFKSNYSKQHRQFGVFLIIQIIGLVFNGILTTVQVEFLGIWPTLARFIAIWIVLIYTYTTNKRVTFGLKDK